MPYFHKIPTYIRWIYPEAWWTIPHEEKTIFLTFDDGVTPQLTEFIVAQLDAFDAKATFFLVGEQSSKYPHLVQLLKDKGHHLGNHTYNHLNGWKVDNSTYLENIAQCQAITQSTLFRPPYGRIKRKQIKALRAKGYEIIMWDLIVGDFDPKISAEICLERMKKHTQSNSIIVLHDNAKFEAKIRYILPRILAFYKQQGFNLLPIPYSLFKK